MVLSNHAYEKDTSGGYKVTKAHRHAHARAK